MFRSLFRAVLVLFGGMIAAQLVELFLTSRRGQSAVRSVGWSELTTYRGVELAKKYSRSVVSALVAALVAVQESLEARTDQSRPTSWPERVQVSAHLLLAAGSVAKIVSEFLDERNRLVDQTIPQ